MSDIISETISQHKINSERLIVKMYHKCAYE